MTLKRYFYVLMLLWFAAFKLQAQQTIYPVQVNVHLLPPYSLYLTDYYSSTREKITVTLINRDQFKPTLNVRLRMTITAAGGVRIQTNDNAYFAPIVVESGAPMRLTQEDLAPYFQHQNLITQGYLSAGKLPEGSVEFCFQVIEAYTGQVLSASTCTRAYVTSQKPPLLSLPQNKESIAFRDPLNVLFQWTPLHQGLAQVEYEFILKELWDNGMTPQAAFPYSPEIYRETTRSTSLIYGAMQPGLLPGKTYAWCVRAKAREGLDEVNLFQNDGYSEIRWFSLQNDCHPPEYVLATAERKRLNLEWNSLPEHIGFTISYRLKSESSFNESQNPWTEQQALETKAILYGLKNGGTYEYRVGGMCMTGQPVYSPIFTVTLPQSDSARLAQCGFMPDIDLTNQEPIKELRTGDVFMANDYPVTITRISGSNGNFTGEGWTIVPWLADVKLAVQFTDIGVNTDKQMYRGYIDAKYDKTEGQIANVDDVFEGGFDVGNVKTGITKIDIKLDFSIPGVDAFELNDAGELVITDSEGEPHVIVPEDKSGQGNEGNKVVVFPMTVEDEDGNVYQVEEVTEKDATGKVIKRDVVAKHVARKSEPLAQDSFDPTQLDGDKAIVTFEKGDGYYAFDTWLDYYDRVSLIEDKYEKLYTGYYVPWKLLVAGKTDVVRARIEIKDKSIDPSKVIFITPQGTQFKADYNSSDKSWTVTLSAGPAGDAQEIYALHPKADGKYYNLGKLSVATYNAQMHNVTLVSVNGAPSDTKIEQTLADVYGPLGITWQVQRDAFDYNEDAMKLMENSTGINTYNDAMRALNNAYRDARSNFNASANYVFFLKATGSKKINDRNLVGFMPRGAQFGYIFTSEIKDIHEPMTVAHELGHGRFKLYHTFDKHYGAVSGSNETDNFMDYNNGLHVAKWQWDIMNDPALLVNVFEGDGKSEYRNSIAYTCIPATLVKLGEQEYYYSLNGKIILLNSKYEPYAFVGKRDSNPDKNKVGSLAIIRRISDGKLYYPAKNDEAYPGYYFRTSSGGLDVNDRFTDFIESTAATPTVVLINPDCSYTIERGSNHVTGKVDDCNCFGQGGAKEGKNGSLVFDKTGENLDLSSIKDLLEGKLSYVDKNLGTLQDLITHLYLTSEKNPEAVREVENTTVPNGVVKIWLHKNNDNLWIVKTGINESRLNDIYQNKFRSSVTFDINKALGNWSSDLTAVATATYKIADWLSSKISVLYIPEAWWNCNNTERFGVSPDDPRYFSPPAFISVVKLVLAPTAVVVDEYIDKMIPKDHPSLSALHELSAADLQFALAVGVWDGLIGLTAALPDAVKLATMSFADNPDAKRQSDEFAKLVEQNGGGVIGVGKMLYNSIVDQFDPSKPCVLAHSVGQAGFDIAVAIFTAGTATTASRFGSTIKAIITTLDKLDVLGNTVGSIAGAGLKVAFKGSSKVLRFTARGGVKLVEAAVEEGKYVLRVLNAAGVAIDEIDWSSSLVRHVQMYGAEGSITNVPVFMNPANQVKDAIYRAKQILKDNDGLEIKNDKGEALVEVEKTITEGGISKTESDIVVVKGITKTLADRLNQFKGIANKINTLDANTRQDFLNDFNTASDDVLFKLDANNGGMIEAWKVVRKHVEMRKHVPTLEKVSELIDDADFIGKLPEGRTDLDDIINAVKNPLNEGGDYKLVKLTDHLQNVKQVVKNHSGADGFRKLLTDLKNSAFAMQDGVTHMLNDVKNFPKNSIKKFDYEFDGDGVACTKCRFDIELSSGSPRLIEYKSWSLENIKNISLKQLLEYFRSASSIEDFKYIFNKLKTPSVAEVKSQFQVIIGDNAKSLFEANPALFKSIKNNDGYPITIQNWQQLEGLAKNNPDFYKSTLFEFIGIK